LEILEYEDIYIKFDTSETTSKMEIKSYSDSSDVYIPSYQTKYSGYMSYEDFIKGLVTENAVAIKIPATEKNIWVRFSLNGSTEAIEKLGNEIK